MRLTKIENPDKNFVSNLIKSFQCYHLDQNERKPFSMLFYFIFFYFSFNFRTHTQTYKVHYTHIFVGEHVCF